MENGTVEKTAWSNYDFVNSKPITYYDADKEKIQKRSREYNRNLSEDEKIKTTNCVNKRSNVRCE